MRHEQLPRGRKAAAMEDGGTTKDEAMARLKAQVAKKGFVHPNPF